MQLFVSITMRWMTALKMKSKYNKYGRKEFYEYKKEGDAA